MKKMFSLLSDNGTACAETTLCETCHANDENIGFATEQGMQSGDIPDCDEFAECSENTMLFCCICDENVSGEKLARSV